MKKNKISVFGATGFIGSRFCDIYPDDVEKIDRDDISTQSPDILYLISTTHNYHPKEGNPFVDIETNLLHLMEVLHYTYEGFYEENNKSGCFNFVSSWFVYGNNGNSRKNFQHSKESDLCNPRGFYSSTKKCAEDLLISYCKTFGVSYRIFRLANVYGENDKFSMQKNALQYLINEMIYDRPIQLYYGGDFYRDYIHVDDVCRAMMFCMSKPRKNYIINIGSGIPYRFGTLIHLAKEMTRSASEITSIEPSEFHKTVQVKDFAMDITKLQHMGFKFEVGMLDGLQRVVDKLRENKHE